MTTPLASAVLTAFTMAVVLYFALWNVSQMVMGVIAAVAVARYRRRRGPRARVLASRLASPPLVSIIMPAYNEELTIVQSVRALLALDYEPHEIVVVNDGSSDGTLDLLVRTFQLVPAPLAFVQPLATAPVRGIYRSIRDPGLVVIDKENGGCKADASNAGINAAAGALVLVIDADTVLEPDALSRAVLPFLEDARTIAVGGHVAISNGCRIDAGRVVEVSLPRSWAARFQIVEYMRAFLLFRAACGQANALPLISGAFGLFRRDAVVAVGGFDRNAIGEDMDLTIRLHAYRGRRPDRFRIAFDPHPLCWTQAPEDWTSLRSQRCRWRRGLLQALWRHRRIIGNPRFGTVGLGALPYVAVFEGLGPLLETTGYIVTTVAALLGLLDWHQYRVLVLASLLFGAAATLLAVLLSDIATRRYMRGRDLFLLIGAALLENCGYRQLNSWWGCVGTVQAVVGKSGWGAMKRRAFES
jgi:cellulose synthase/poly-beta-1,6-N-acetylglucosamine synthase-like glycosyltransferase